MARRASASLQHLLIGHAAAVLGLSLPSSAMADEGGASVYLLGSGGPGAAVLPPLEGVYFENDMFYYEGSAGGERQFVVGGNLVAGLDAKIYADFPTVIWVPSTNFAGGTLAIGAALPIGGPSVTVDAVITGPLGGQVSISRSDSTFLIADPVVTAVLGWKSGNLHFALSGLVNIPVGRYREGELANLAFHRWAEDVSAAVSYHDAEAGWDVSAKAGVTFNGKNDFTDYDSGNDFHLEGAVEKIFSPAWSAGVQAYYFKQISGDSGAGARLGDFKGEVTGVGGTIAYNFTLAGTPTAARLKVLTEFDATNRLEGTSVLLSLAIPLSVKLPAGAAE